MIFHRLARMHGSPRKGKKTGSQPSVGQLGSHEKMDGSRKGAPAEEGEKPIAQDGVATSSTRRFVPKEHGERKEEFSEGWEKPQKRRRAKGEKKDSAAY